MPASMAINSDLPRTMARIRRLVRENPNDRELQRLLHTLLTSMSADRIDEAAVRSVLAQMEERSHASKTPLSPAPAVPDRHLIPNLSAADILRPSLAPAPLAPTGYAMAPMATPGGSPLRDGETGAPPPSACASYPAASPMPRPDWHPPAELSASAYDSAYGSLAVERPRLHPRASVAFSLFCFYSGKQ